MSDERRPAAPIIAVALALTLGSLAGCGGSSPQAQVVVDLDDLRTPVGCGDGFQATNETATVGILLRPATGESSPTEERVELGDGGPWSGEIRLGRDLFATWCGGVVDGEPRVDETWELVEGVVEVTEVDESTGIPSATMTATGLVAVDPDGARHELGDIVLVNDAWGMRGE